MLRPSTAGARAVLAVAWLAVTVGSAAGDPVATVNGKPVDQSVLYEYMLKRDGYRSLLNVVASEVIRQAAEKKGVTVTEQEIDAIVAHNRENLDRTAVLTGADFDVVLASQGLTLPLYRENERPLLYLKKLVQDQVSITDAQVREQYQRNQSDFRLAEAMKVSFIQFETAEKASEVRQSIIAGQITFENAAKQFSTDRYTKENGGKLRDWVQRTQTPFSQAAFGLLQDGDVSDVVEYPGLGYFLIRRNSYVRNYQIDFDEVKDDLKALMIQELTQRLAAAKQDELMKAADIKIVVQWPEGSVVPSREAVVPPAPPR